jgi:Flp pilus assembly protein TadG
VFLAVAVTGLLVLAGLVVDGGGKVRAAQRADRVAAEAGRAAAQQLDVPGALAGQRPRVRVQPAVAAARRYLQDQQVSGAVSVSPDRRRITVQVTSTVRTVFLALIGVSELTAHGSAQVELVPGVTTEEP